MIYSVYSVHVWKLIEYKIWRTCVFGFIKFNIFKEIFLIIIARGRLTI